MVIFISIINKKLKIKNMGGCGCKNKSNNTQQSVSSQQPSQNQTLSQVQAQQTQNASIQESIRKVVEKYYNKK